jgi:hypothetical protein
MRKAVRSLLSCVFEWKEFQFVIVAWGNVWNSNLASMRLIVRRCEKSSHCRSHRCQNVRISSLIVADSRLGDFSECHRVFEVCQWDDEVFQTSLMAQGLCNCHLSHMAPHLEVARCRPCHAKMNIRSSIFISSLCLSRRNSWPRMASFCHLRPQTFC